MVTHTLSVMWIDDTSADVIKVDFEALYHGDFLVEGDTSEQLDDAAPLALRVPTRAPSALPSRPCPPTGR
jgi:hypothetical protein